MNDSDEKRAERERIRRKRTGNDATTPEAFALSTQDARCAEVLGEDVDMLLERISSAPPTSLGEVSIEEPDGDEITTGLHGPVQPAMVTQIIRPHVRGDGAIGRKEGEADDTTQPRVVQLREGEGLGLENIPSEERTGQVTLTPFPAQPAPAVVHNATVPADGRDVLVDDGTASGLQLKTEDDEPTRPTPPVTWHSGKTGVDGPPNAFATALMVVHGRQPGEPPAQASTPPARRAPAVEVNAETPDEGLGHEAFFAKAEAPVVAANSEGSSLRVPIIAFIAVMIMLILAVVWLSKSDDIEVSEIVLTPAPVVRKVEAVPTADASAVEQKVVPIPALAAPKLPPAKRPAEVKRSVPKPSKAKVARPKVKKKKRPPCQEKRGDAKKLCCDKRTQKLAFSEFDSCMAKPDVWRPNGR